MPRKPKPLDEAEEIAILEEIARTGSPIARINALRDLRKLRGRADEKGDQAEDDDEFADLDELEPRRRRKK